MRSEVIANRYAQALLASATEHQCAEAVLETAQGYQKAAAASLTPLLENPKIPHETKKGLLEKLFSRADQGDSSKEAVSSKLLFHFILLLLKKGRIGYLGDIFRLYPKRYEERIGVVKAKLYLAYPMQSDLIDRLKSKLAAKFRKRVALDIIHDPPILGGFIFATDTEQIDASLKRHLLDLEEHLKTAAIG